jgi:excinuclease UvrABC nuclease subunit
MMAAHTKAKWVGETSLIYTPEFEFWDDLVNHTQSIPGVYSVWSGNKVLYIGSSHRMRRRLRGHNQWPKFVEYRVTEVRCIEVQDHRERLAMERWLIRKHRPCLNGKMGPKVVQ